MKILVLTSCTGEKAVESTDGLTLADFQKGPAHVATREARVKNLMRSAEDIYTGQQHVRLMRGVKAFRDAQVATGEAHSIDLHVLSAGYGLVPGAQLLAPYEATFQGMKSRELRDWADTLNVPAAVRGLLAQPYDLAILLLGDGYLAACNLDGGVVLGGPTLVFAGTGSAKTLPALPRLRVQTLSNPEAKRFRCGLVSLKGELTARLLSLASANPSRTVPDLLAASDLLARLERGPAPESKQERPSPPEKQVAKSPPRPKPDVDVVIDLPQDWGRSDRIRYFIPEWDDLVDADFDFVNEVHSGGSGDWTNEVYAHQLLGRPAYDGILVSREVVKKLEKVKRLAQLGIHRYLRVPRHFQIMGDCGAFGYIDQDVPPYSTTEVIDYYTRNDFDYGVSVDHLIVKNTEEKKRERYDITIQNAEEFLREHRKQGLKWEPIGAVQGWDPKTYAAAAEKYVKMGYRYLGLGGLVRSNTKQILAILSAVRRVVPVETRLHLFGIARLDAMSEFARSGANSIDNASMLRKAWLGQDLNYLTAAGWYSAVRVPETKEEGERGGSFRAKRLVRSGQMTLENLRTMERSCLQGLRAYANSRAPVPSSALLDDLVAYDGLVAGERKGTRGRIERTLAERPWEHCPCEICQKWGIEVLIFRGNNRNRRRGFHNTHVFYGLLRQVLSGEKLLGDLANIEQMRLFAQMEDSR